MARHFSYYSDWKSAILECPRCGWKGTFEQGSVDYHGELMDSTCPSCSWVDAPILAIVSYPTMRETGQNWSRLSESEKRQHTEREQFLEQWEAACLKAHDQLPDLDGADLTILWDQVKVGAEHFTVLRHGAIELWREPTLWEGYERFIEIVQILRQKYGARLADVVPTAASRTYLYGDKLSASEQVRAARGAMKR